MRPTSGSRRWAASAVLLVVLSFAAGAPVASADGITATYDTLNRLRTVSYCDGRVLTYNYDAAGNRASYVATPPSLTAAVSAPNGGETWIVGTTHSITWSGIGLGGSVEISLSRDNAATWQSLFASTPNDGTESWTITGAPAAGARIRVRSTSCRAISDSSDAVFVIQAPGAPVVTTPTFASVAGATATLGATVVTDGGGVITERGVVYSATSTNGDPVIGGTGATKAQTIGATGVFTVGVTGLTPGTAYTFRGYAINAAGTAYSTLGAFTTLASPTVIAPTVTVLSSTAATVGGQVTSDGGAAISERGVVWSLTSVNSNPTIGASGVIKSTAAGTIGALAVSLSGLNPGTGYTFRAFATNSQGVAYTTATAFTTLTLPSVMSPATVSVLSTSATLGGTVASDGGTLIIERGIVYSTTAANSNPMVGGPSTTKVPTSGTTGAFTVVVAGLSSGTGYSFAAYAMNSVGTRHTSPASTFTTVGAPLVGSPTITSVTATSATLGGNVTSDGGSAITERGVVYAPASTNPDPAIGGTGVAKIVAGGATGVFTLPVTGLTSGTAYAFKAYATSIIGTSYTTPATTFTTLAAPTVTTPAATTVTSTGATLGGNVASDGGSAITERGVVYALTATNANPLINGAGVTKLVATGTTGVFTVSATGLTQGTGYSYKAYAINAIGTSYTGPVATFTTLATPALTAPTSASIAATTATLGGNVTSDGGTPITERGVVYSATSANANPEISGPGVVKVPTAGTTGVFTVNVAGLSAGTGYSFKAYAVNLVGTTYTSPASTFTTPGPPTVTAPTLASLTSTGVTLGGNVTSNGGSAITERGVVYALASTNADPVIGGVGVTKMASGAATGVFTVPIAGLLEGTAYVFKAYATNIIGTTHTTPATAFTTLAAPTVATPAATALTATGAALGGNVVSDGGSAILERGVVYSLTASNANPLISGAGVTKLVGTGSTGVFTVPASGLTPGTGYSYKAYAINAVGTSYTTPAATFTTFALPTVTTPTSTAVAAATATLGGNVTGDGGTPITERGVVYSVTSANPNPEVGGTNVVKVPTSGTMGVFTVNVAGLATGTGYSFKAYATNLVGTTHTGPASTFTTPAAPTVTTPTSASVTSVSATLGGNVTSDGGSAVTERGVVFAISSVNSDPTIAGTGVTTLPVAGTTGVLTASATGLTPGVPYTFKAYAKNAAGTAYTTSATFTTLTVPTVLAPGSSLVTSTSATLAGTVSSDGGSSIVERGFVYSVASANPNPLIAGVGVTKLVGSGATGPLTLPTTGLTSGTAYAFKAYATNSVGTGYTTVSAFTTLALPAISTPTATAVAGTTAILGGTVTSNGGDVITERGVVYAATALNANPEMGGAFVTTAPTSGALGTFGVNVAGLAPGTAYSFRAYVANSVGAVYTAPVSTFTTLTSPTVTGPTSSMRTTNSALLGGNVTDDGGSAIAERGVVYSLASLNTDPEIGELGVVKASTSGSLGSFTVPVSGLAPGTRYSVRAYATNAIGSAYSPAATVSTLVQVSLGDVAVLEGDSGSTAAVFAVTLSAASDDTVTVSIATSDLSANAGADYTATGPLTLTFSPGVTTQLFSVPVHGDTASESTETFQVSLFAAVNADILVPVAIGTITNDDAEPPARVFVAPSGSDTNDCANQNTPCRNLAGAIAQVAIDGEVIVLSSGAYDTVPILITKGLKVSSPAGAVVFISQPITVNAPGGRVALRGLTIQGAGTGAAITLTAAAGLSIEDTTIGRWSAGLQISNSVAAHISIAHSVFRANTAGIKNNGAAALNRISVEDTRFERNTRGIEVLSGAFMIRESAFIGNTAHGVITGPGSATIYRSDFSQNATAVAALSGGTVRLSRSRVFGNTLGLSAAAGGTFESTGKNVVRRNTTNTSGTITTIPEQ